MGAASETDCNMPCSGDSSKKCGSGCKNSVYEIFGKIYYLNLNRDFEEFIHSFLA